MRFVKMHGLGNDYVYINTFDPDNAAALADPAALAQQVADRHFGIGGDGLILLMPPDPPASALGAQLRMRMFNADGSEAEMCGNGIRCVCKLAHDDQVTSGIRNANPMKIQTGNGVLSLEYTTDDTGHVDTVTVDMGEPILELADVPVDEEKLDDRLHGAAFVSMGNPHAMIYVDTDTPLENAPLGAELEHHPAFPNRVNVHFVRVNSPTDVDVYHWERGSGATLACGTGACAVCVAGVLSGRTEREITAHLPGGDLVLRWDEPSNHVFMTGPATEVFRGDWPAT